MNEIHVVAGQRVAADVAIKQDAIAEDERPVDHETDAEQDQAGEFAPRAGGGGDWFVIHDFVSHETSLSAQVTVVPKRVPGFISVELLANG